MQKGYTLVELIFTITLMSMLLLLQGNFLYYSIIDYEKNIKSDREGFYSKEALRFVESEVNDFKNIYIKINNNSLILTKSNDDKNIICPIKKYNGNKKLAIKYLNQKYGNTTTDTILDDITKFSIVQKDRVIFVSIQYKGGNNFEKCIGIGEGVKVL